MVFPDEPLAVVPPELRDILVSVDHLLPQVHGGTYEQHNVRLTHAYCNEKRGYGPISLVNLGSVRFAQRILAPLLAYGAIDPDHKAVKANGHIFRVAPHLLAKAP